MCAELNTDNLTELYENYLTSFLYKLGNIKYAVLIIWKIASQFSLII